MSEEAPDLWRKVVRRRVAVTALIFAVWVTSIEARLCFLQVFRRDEYVARAERQQMRTVEIPAKRGEILDRNGRVLAYSVDADSIYAVPSEIRDAGAAVRALCGALRDCSPEFRAGLLEKLRNRKRAFAWVRRQAAPDAARRVDRLDLEGIGLMKESRRFYPNTTIASHVLGYVGLDNRGLGGIEASYDRDISGKPGTALVQTDARRHAFSRTEKPPTSGATVELTIDTVLQWIAQRELKAGVLENRAAGGSAIIMDPWTGEILAMANEPTFNPNAGDVRPDDLHNRAIEAIYEPGSTFKVVTASAALEEHVIKPTDIVNTSPGRMMIGSRLVHDTRNHGVLSFEDVIVESSNIGAIKVGFMLGPERLSRYVRRFGFGRAELPDLRGEAPGIVWSQLSDSALASMSMGYQVGVTPLQMATAVSAVANGGQLMQPRLVRAIDSNGARRMVAPRVVRRAILPETSATLTEIMEQVVSRGTAKSAQIEGYAIAGKTGTAAKLENGVYSHSKYNASFVGFLPSRSPVVTILVVIDSPAAGKYYGGSVSAPVFKRIAEAVLRHYGIPRTFDPAPPVLVAGSTSSGAVPVKDAPRDAAVSAVNVADPHAVPDLRGAGAREAMRTLVQLGLRPKMHGDGVVTAQQPAPGTPIEQTGQCELWLDRLEPAAADASPGEARP